MRQLLRVSAVAVFAAAMIMGCTTPEGPQRRDAGRRPPVDRPENAYYYYVEAQMAKQDGDNEKAAALLSKAIEIDPETLYLRKELALEYVQLKDQQRTLAVVEDILAVYPDDVEMLILYGRIRQSQNQIDEAARAYKRALDIDKGQQNAYLLLGGIYLQNNRLDEARSVFEEMVGNFPDAYTGHLFLGKIYAKQGRNDKAELAFKKALELEPNLLEPRFELLELYKDQGKTDIIVRTYEDILKNNPMNIRAALELGLIYWKEGRPKVAEKTFLDLGRRSSNEFDVILKVIQTYLEPDRHQDAIIVLEGLLKGSPDNPDLHHLAGVAYYDTKNNEKALLHFSKVTPQSRFYQDAVVHLAFLYRENGQTQDAIDLMEKTVKSFPENAEFVYYLGTFYEEKEEYEKAAELFNRSIQIEPDETKYHFRLGVVYDKWGRKDDSIAAMRTVIDLDPSDANALNYLGYTYADLGKNLDEAEQLIKEALKYKPDDGYITDSLGWVYYKKGDYAKALEILKKAVELVPDDPIILEHLGDAYLKAGDTKNARQAYERSLEKQHKDRPAIEEKIKNLPEHR
jgi:tetratricopeptide (TPR) repeat protein